MPDNGAQQQDVTVTIDGVAVRVPKGTLLVEAAKRIDREIPVYCYHTKMGPAGLCRICLVDIEGMPKLQIACNTPVTDGMVVHTQNDKAADGRRAVLELYLKNHPLDCPICDKGGECDLQDYAMAYGQDYSRSADPKIAKPKAVDLGPTIVLDEERCVVCQRCVRFDDIIVGERELVLKDRGAHDIIATATGKPYRHNFTGNVTELCPVGALTSKTYRFKARPWDLKRTSTTCSQCSVGCQMHVDVRVGTVMRTLSVQSDDAISDTWLCDRGRYNVGFYGAPERLREPLYKQNGEWMQIGWDDALQLWATAIAEAVKVNPQSVGVVGGGRLTNEEAYLLQHIFRAQGVTNLDWRAGRQRQATPGRGSARLAEIESADAIIEIGESPAERAPIFDLRIRKAAARMGAKLIRVASLERRYPPPIPSADVRTIEDALDALPAGARRIAVIWDGVDLAMGKAIVEALPKEAKLLAYITGEQPNARGAEAMGMHPAFAPGYSPTPAGRDTAAMLADARDGQIAVLNLLGVNPALHFPDARFVQEALAKVPFVVVSDLFRTQTGELATLLLPAKGPFEKTGTTINLAGDVLPVNAARGLAVPSGALSDLEMAIGLGERLGVVLPSAEALDTAVLRCAASAPAQFTFGDDVFARAASAAAARTASEEERAFSVVVRENLFAGGGTSAHDDRIAALRPVFEAAIGAADAAQLGISAGDALEIRGDETVCAFAVVHRSIPAGTVTLIGGLPGSPANVFPEGARVRIARVQAQQPLGSAVR